MKNVLILGSGRSGTSMLTGILADSGYHLGDRSDYLGINKANPKGFFEDYEVNTINEDLIALNIINIPENIRMRFFRSFTFYRARWLAQIPSFIKFKSNNALDARIKDVVNNKPFCYKDPRFSYTLPVWDKFLNEDTVYLVIYREPWKTAESIVRECNENPAIQEKLKMTYDSALNTWKCMYEFLLKTYNQSNDKSRWMFIHYNQTFERETIQNIEELILVNVNADFAEKHISRTKSSTRTISRKIAHIYKSLNELANYNPEN
ncbi:hypothetical protein [Robertkochia solimangrovi]|uniref:hypothetical protein n=1 Tax=Robertkochia solimangrovi TaxID=2213046 RepID=UPI00117DAEE1|nr:hypothetical protein [Robertkochia solimangrovi]TRZ44973.1 hypothetical protein DMZ48_04220 [Robertkochia solimangrovi]